MIFGEITRQASVTGSSPVTLGKYSPHNITPLSKPNRNRSADIFGAFQPKCRTVIGNGVLNNGKPEPRAARFL